MRFESLSVFVAVGALLSAHAWLWVTRPSAQPMSPHQLQQVLADEAEPAKPVRMTTETPPLELTLDRDPIMPAGDAGDETRKALRDSPRLDLELGAREPLRPAMDEAPLFDHERGTRAVSTGVWVSEAVRVRGGVGYTPDTRGDERDIAVGVGVTLAF